MQLILASGSPYRRDLLKRLRIPFETLSPDIDESPADGEKPPALATRLAAGKALAAAQQLSGPSLVIGSDQVATLDGYQPLGKPGSHANACAQLRQSSGRQCVFHTAVCVLRTSDGAQFTETINTTVKFRDLTDQMIERYLKAERPYDCAGSAKSEGLGIALLESLEGPDPTALVGLPLIALTGLLSQAGFEVLDHINRADA